LPGSSWAAWSRRTSWPSAIAVEAGYTATAIDKYGVSFDLEGSLKFQTVFTR
jgi:hypothetical protein